MATSMVALQAGLLSPPLCDIHTFQFPCSLAHAAVLSLKRRNVPAFHSSGSCLSSQCLNRDLRNSSFSLFIFSGFLFIFQSLLGLKLQNKSAGQRAGVEDGVSTIPKHGVFISLTAHWPCSWKKLPRLFCSLRLHGLRPPLTFQDVCVCSVYNLGSTLQPPKIFTAYGIKWN